MKTRVTIIAAALALLGSRQEGFAQYTGYASPQGYVLMDPAIYSASNLAAQQAGYESNMASSTAAVASGGGVGNAYYGSNCCTPTWQLFGDFLYLRPRDAEVAYAVPIDGPIVPPPAANPIQIGRTAVVDPSYEPAFRVGFSYAADCSSCMTGTWTHFESNTSDQISIGAPNVIRSMVSHPSTLSASADFLSAAAQYSLDFDLVDADFHGLLASGCSYSLNYLVGARYGRLQQDFYSLFSNNGTETVITDINFEGGGLRMGLEGERQLGGGCFMVYGRTVASFVAGVFKAQYNQWESFDAQVVNTNWRAGRIVAMLDLELGVGWTSPDSKLRFSAGYLMSAWYNTVKVNEYIRAVQSNNVLNLGDVLTFDGLVARAEIRF